MCLTGRGMLLLRLPPTSRSAVVVYRLLHRIEEVAQVAQHVAQAGGGADIKQALGVCMQSSR